MNELQNEIKANHNELMRRKENKKMKRITKAMLEQRVEELNRSLSALNINKTYEVAYRYDYCALDQQSLNQKYCITGDSLTGTKKEIYKYMYAMIKALV